MVWNRFNLLIWIQIILIAGVSMLIAISIRKEFLLMTTVGLILLWLGQIMFLNFYMNRIHRDMHKFLEALKNQDTSQLFNRQHQGNYFRKLYSGFNEITRNFRLVRIEKEAENQFFHETIKQSASGILAVRADGKISLINSAALQILGLEDLRELAELNASHPELAEILGSEELRGSPDVKLLAGGKIVQLAVKSTEMELRGETVRIFSLLDISREMAKNEVEAWQKLIRVLSHEITNSVTPIHILATSLFDLLQQEKGQKSPSQMDEQTLDRIILGVKTIMKRSGGLSDFLHTYKSFSSPGEPEYSTVLLSKMFGHIYSLLERECGKSGINFTLNVHPVDLVIVADETLIEQTLINLIQNSIHALKDSPDPSIKLKAYQLDARVTIEVTDNGKGIPGEILDHIFTPFFTTRKEGSGIGLSLARQIMLMHKGSIQVYSLEGEQTTFTLSF